MKQFFTGILILVSSFSILGARSVAIDSTTLVAVQIDSETVLHFFPEEVSAADFIRLMPGTGEPGGNGPAHSITREEAEEYARRLTQLNRRLGLLTEMEFFRLPTLAEWRFAASLPEELREGLHQLESGVRELCADTKSERFPSRDNPATTVEYQYGAVIGAHDKLDPDAVAEAMSRPAWIRFESRSAIVGFRLVLKTTRHQADGTSGSSVRAFGGHLDENTCHDRDK